MELKACKLKACANTFSTGTSKRTLISSIVRKGEAIEINKIDTALRNVGISLADFVSGAVGLDVIFDQLGRKWDTLDTAT